MTRRFPQHPSHSPAPAWLAAVAGDLARLGHPQLAHDMGVAPVADLDIEREARRASR